MEAARDWSCLADPALRLALEPDKRPLVLADVRLEALKTALIMLLHVRQSARARSAHMW